MEHWLQKMQIFNSSIPSSPPDKISGFAFDVLMHKYAMESLLPELIHQPLLQYFFTMVICCLGFSRQQNLPQTTSLISIYTKKINPNIHTKKSTLFMHI